VGFSELDCPDLPGRPSPVLLSPQAESNRADSPWLRPALWGVFGTCLLSSLALLLVGLHNTLYSDLHSFRQCQTALTCFYMLKSGLTLRYQTPVLGPPWPSAVFEFPAYQWVVVELTRYLGVPLDAAGRAVSIVFFLLILVPLYAVLAALGVARTHRLVFLSLFVASPFYIFWSRTFMIESTALFFCAAYAACVIQYAWHQSHGEVRKGPRYLPVLALIFGSLGALIKVTTFPSFGLATALYVYRGYLRWPVRKPDWRALARQTALLLVTGGIPVLCVTVWTHFADSVKAIHPIAHYETSRLLIPWNFGTVQQKLSYGTWFEIFSNARSMLLNYHAVLWVGIVVAAVVTRRRWKEALACAFLFLSAPLVFTNLYVMHEYYMYANGIFLLCATGFCVLGVLESPKGAAAGFGATLVILTMAAGTYFHRYYPMQKHNNTSMANAVQLVDSRVDADAVIVCNVDWDPTIPYVFGRRTLMLPQWTYLTDDDVQSELRLLRGYKIGALFIGDSPKARSTQSIMQMMDSAGLKVKDLYSAEYHDGIWNVSPVAPPPHT
jgi:hypothetical protein